MVCIFAYNYQKVMGKGNNLKEAKLTDLIPDDLNANKGTEYGTHLMENSIRKFGAGRSILLDKNNRIIAGNKTTEQAAAIGLDNVIIVETTGNQIVAVKRMDIDLDTAQGREMAIADNASAKANIEWDEEAIKAITEKWEEVDPVEWGIKIEEEENNELVFGEKEIEEEVATDHECPKCGFKW
jgi:hypothetical protein